MQKVDKNWAEYEELHIVCQIPCPGKALKIKTLILLLHYHTNNTNSVVDAKLDWTAPHTCRMEKNRQHGPHVPSRVMANAKVLC